MARRKNAPESIKIKQGLSDRLRSLRTEFYGDRGGPDLARTLGIPVRTWYNYENGVTVPAEIILRIVELTAVEAVWLLRGEGPKFRSNATGPGSSRSGGRSDGLASSSVTTLLRAALERLEEEERSVGEYVFGPPIVTRRDDEVVANGCPPASTGEIGLDGQAASSDDFRPEAVPVELLESRRNFRTL